VGYFSINNKVNLGLEYTFRPTTSDLIDGTPGGFAVDVYSYLAIGVTFNFNKGTRKMPEVVDINEDKPLILNLPNCDPIPPPTRQNQMMGMAKLPAAPSIAGDMGDAYSYKVQIFAFSQHIYSAETIEKRYHISMVVDREYNNGLYRFTVGSTDSYQEAREIRDLMLLEGVLDAFIVAFNKEGKRLPFDQSLQY